MLTSVIVLTFNRKKMLKEAIDSILAQTVKDFELIIIDNCSKDGTGDFVRTYKDKRIRYFKNENKGIIATNLNFGLGQARGKYIALCDDDDIWSPEKLENELRIMEKEKEVAVVCTNAVNFDENGEGSLVVKNRMTFAKSPYISQKETLIKNAIVQSSVLIRKDVLDEIGHFNENPEYVSCEDFELWVRILKKYKAYLLDKPLVKYRTHANVFRTTSLKHHNILKKIIDYLERGGHVSKPAYIIFLLRHYFFVLVNVTGINRIYFALKMDFY